MVRDVVGNILGDEPDLCVVADGVPPGALIERVERERPDVVVFWVESDSPPKMCDELLGLFPRLAVVALEDRGECASIYMMRPMRFRLGEISRTHLVTAIRRAARPARGPARVGVTRPDVAGILASRAGSARPAPETGVGPSRERNRGGPGS